MPGVLMEGTVDEANSGKFRRILQGLGHGVEEVYRAYAREIRSTGRYDLPCPPVRD